MYNLHYEQFPDGTVKCIEDEIPFDVPDGWAWSRFSSAFIINPRNHLSDDTAVSFVPMPLIQEGYSNMHTYDEKLWSKVKSGFTHFANNDVGVAKITPCFENKKSVIFKDLKNGYGAGTTELHIIRTVGNNIYPEYVLWNIKTDNFIANGTNAFSGAVGQKRIGRDFIEKSLIPIPPINEQRRIIDCISSTFMLIDYIDNSMKGLKSNIQIIKSKILDLAIRGKLVPHNPNDEPASVLLERIRTEKEELIKQGKIKRDKKESVIFKGEDNSYYDAIIPQSWEITNLSDVTLNISDGSHNPPPKKNKGVPLLSATNIYDNKINYTSATRWITEDEWIIENARTKIEVGDVLITIVGTIGRTAVVSNTTRFALQRSVAVMKPNMIDSKYLMYVLQAPMIIDWLNANAKGNAQVGIYLKDLAKLSFPLPPLAEQKRIVEAIETVFAQLDEILNSIS